MQLLAQSPVENIDESAVILRLQQPARLVHALPQDTGMAWSQVWSCRRIQDQKLSHHEVCECVSEFAHAMSRVWYAIRGVLPDDAYLFDGEMFGTVEGLTTCDYY